MSDCSYCCGNDLPPALSVARITCGYTLASINYHTSVRGDLPDADLLSHMRFKRRGNPLHKNGTISKQYYECCDGDPDTWVLAYEFQATDTDIKYIQYYEYRLEEACGATSPPCCQADLAIVSGTGTRYEYAANCFGGEVITDMTSESNVGYVSGGTPFLLWNGILNYDEIEDYGLSLPVGASPCTDGIYTTTTDTYALSKQESPIGIIQTRTYESESSGWPDNPNCGALIDNCTSSAEIIFGYDTPDEYRLRFTFTAQNPAPYPNHCRVLAKLYFTPWLWDTAEWGTEVEQATIDFKWKEGDAPYIHEEAYPDLGKFRLGIVSVYLAGKGRPDRYEFTP